MQMVGKFTLGGLVSICVSAGIGSARAETGPVEAAPAYRDAVLAALAPKPGGLTADQAATRASETSPAMAVKRAELAVARARASRTLARYLPKLELTASFTRTSAADVDLGGGGGFIVGALSEGPLSVGACPDGTNNCVLDSAGEQVTAVGFGGFETPRNSYSVVANLVIPFSDYAFSLRLAREALRNDQGAVIEETHAEAAKVATDARVAFYEWLRTVAQVAVAEQAVSGAEARLEDARLGLAGGVLAPADVAQIESILVSTRVALANARSFERLARENLAVMMGEPVRDFVIGENVLAHEGSLEPSGSAAELIAHGKANRREIRALAERERAAELGVKSMSIGLYPRLDGIVNVTHANPNQQFFPPAPEWNTSWYVGLTASWALDRYFDTRAQVKELEANIQMIAAQRVTVERAIELEVTMAWQEWQRAVSTLALSQQELDAAEAAHAQRVILYRGGEATTTDVIETEMQRHNATLRFVGAHVDLHIARVKLERAAAMNRDGAP